MTHAALRPPSSSASSLLHRPRRLRASAALREMVRESQFDPADLILPLFVSEKVGVPTPVTSMPGVSQLPLEALVDVAGSAHRDDGISSVLLFGVPARKDEEGSGAWSEEGIVQRAVRALKAAVPGLVVVADVCLCEYTSHGHCGVVAARESRGPASGGPPNGPGPEFVVRNDESVDLLARTAVSLAVAGADVVAPSDMMDGRVGAIRAALDNRGFTDVVLMSYAAKFASAFYGPFREAAEGAPRFGDRRTYQMDPANGREALREVELDLAEGADVIIVKPGLPYLDVLWRVKERFGRPTAVYNVSGEYAMLKAAAAHGWLDERAAVTELMTSFKRAGADLIITYWAREVARWWRQEHGWSAPADVI